MIATTLLAALALAGPADDARNHRHVTYYSERDFASAGMNLGPTGAWGYMHGAGYVVVSVVEGSPADGVLEPYDLVVGAGPHELADHADPRRALGLAITAAETREERGRLKLRVRRNGRLRTSMVVLPIQPGYGSDWPTACAKSDAVFDAACDFIMREGQINGGVYGAMNALALLASDDPAHQERARRHAHFGIREPGPNDWSWGLGYSGIFLAEYHLATGDASVLPRLKSITDRLAAGQYTCGSWGHKLPEIGESGYGVVNQTGLTAAMAILMARACGLDVDDERLTRSLDFFRQYAGHGWIPYGDHPPYMGRSDNGKNSIAAVLYDIAGEAGVRDAFAVSVPPSWGEREVGHTGPLFSLVWGPLGAALAPRTDFRTFMDHQQWYYDLIRTHDGALVCFDNGDRGFKYGDPRATTGGLALTFALGRKRLRILGGGRENSGPLPSRAGSLALIERSLERGEAWLADQQIQSLAIALGGSDPALDRLARRVDPDAVQRTKPLRSRGRYKPGRPADDVAWQELLEPGDGQSVKDGDVFVIRRAFEVDDHRAVGRLRLRLMCVEGTEVFLNGQRICEALSATRNRVATIPLRESASETLRRRRNEIVVTAPRPPRGGMRVGLDVERTR